jgi:hypothetical protein
MSTPPTRPIPSARQFELLPTRDPSRPSFRISESSQTFQPENVPFQGQAFGDCRGLIVSRGQQSLFRKYTYQYMSKEGDTLWFYFCFPYSTEVSADGTPLNEIPFNTFYTNKRWSWPAVLHALTFVKDEYFPAAVQAPDPRNPGTIMSVFYPRVYPRKVFTAPANALCRCLVEQFCSDTPFPPSANIQPTPDTVEWDFPTSRGGITCLHPRIEIPSRGNEYAVVTNGTRSSVPASGNNTRIYPATNFRNWEPFIISDEVVRENGVYFRERVTIYPPAQNRKVIE